MPKGAERATSRRLGFFYFRWDLILLSALFSPFPPRFFAFLPSHQIFLPKSEGLLGCSETRVDRASQSTYSETPCLCGAQGKFSENAHFTIFLCTTLQSLVYSTQRFLCALTSPCADTFSSNITRLAVYPALHPAHLYTSGRCYFLSASITLRCCFFILLTCLVVVIPPHAQPFFYRANQNCFVHQHNPVLPPFRTIHALCRGPCVIPKSFVYNAPRWLCARASLYRRLFKPHTRLSVVLRYTQAFLHTANQD